MIRMTDAAVSPFQAVSNRGETGKTKTILKNLPSVSLFQRFEERCGRNSNGGRLLIEIRVGLPLKNSETAKQTAFHCTISMPYLFHLGLKQFEIARPNGRTCI
jgi:hypothetical protein